MKLLASTKKKITKNKNSEIASHSEITEVLLVHRNITNTDYRQDSRVFYTFVPNKSFGKLFDISPETFIFKKTFNSEFSYIKVWFIDQSPKPLEIEDKINLI